MTEKRRLVHAVFLLLLPIAVAAFGWSVATAVALVILMLFWRWAIALSTFVLPGSAPALVLETISASHFVEKVRWNLDAAGIEYQERPAGGTLGAYFAGRTVPRLNVQTGAVRSQIGNSAEILRYLWGAYAAVIGERAVHLEPTPERLELEKQLDRHGAYLQVWIYNHLLDDRELTLRAWGVENPAVPAWQRGLIRLLFPLQRYLIRRTFRITSSSAAKATQRIEELLEDIDTRLADGRLSILGGEQLNYTDYAFAAMCGLWMQPAAYGGGKAEPCRIERDQVPGPMLEDIDRWSEDHPRVVDWVYARYESRLESKLPAGQATPNDSAAQSESHATETPAAQSGHT